MIPIDRVEPLVDLNSVIGKRLPLRLQETGGKPVMAIGVGDHRQAKDRLPYLANAPLGVGQNTSPIDAPCRQDIMVGPDPYRPVGAFKTNLGHPTSLNRPV